MRSGNDGHCCYDVPMSVFAAIFKHFAYSRSIIAHANLSRTRGRRVYRGTHVIHEQKYERRCYCLINQAEAPTYRARLLVRTRHIRLIICSAHLSELNDSRCFSTATLGRARQIVEGARAHTPSHPLFRFLGTTASNEGLHTTYSSILHKESSCDKT